MHTSSSPCYTDTLTSYFCHVCNVSFHLINAMYYDSTTRVEST